LRLAGQQPGRDRVIKLASVDNSRFCFEFRDLNQVTRLPSIQPRSLREHCRTARGYPLRSNSSTKFPPHADTSPISPHNDLSSKGFCFIPVQFYVLLVCCTERGTIRSTRNGTPFQRGRISVVSSGFVFEGREAGKS